MKSSERLLTAFRGGQPDRVPVGCWLSLRLLDRITGQAPKQFLDSFVEDPNNTLIKIQEDLGLDPILVTFSELEDEVIHWPRRLTRWPKEAFDTWQVKTELLEQDSDSKTLRRTITTPGGELTSIYGRQRYQKWAREHLLKDEQDLELLKYRPNPELLDVSVLKEMVCKVGDRGVFMHNFPGVWYEASGLHNLVTVSTDTYDRPEWLHRFFSELTDYLIRLVNKVLDSGVQVIILDESWVGVGISKETFEEFVLPYDKRIIDAIHARGALVDYHNCGRVTALLESMVDTGADILEPLTPPILNGDIELAEAKRRVGHRAALFGGFNERVLNGDKREDIIQEVHRVIDAAAAGGGYGIRSAGQLFHAKPDNIQIMTEEIQRYGLYEKAKVVARSEPQAVGLRS